MILVVSPHLGHGGEAVPGPFHAYRDTGDWLAENVRTGERILDLTDWSLYFSRRPGYGFAKVYEAPADPDLRWVVVRQPHLEGRWSYSSVVRDLVSGQDPVAVVPANPRPGEVQVRIYDRRLPGTHATALKQAGSPDATRR